MIPACHAALFLQHTARLGAALPLLLTHSWGAGVWGSHRLLSQPAQGPPERLCSLSAAHSSFPPPPTDVLVPQGWDQA